MFLSPMRMDMQVPDVPMSVMTHGTVVTNMIPPHAAQDGLATRRVDNASWLTQEMALVANPDAQTTADHMMSLLTDATLPVIPATPVRKETLDVAQTEALRAEAALTQIQASFTDVTKPIQRTHSASLATLRMPLTANQEPKHATVALHHPSSSPVIQRRSAASQLTTLEISNRLVMQVVDTLPQASS
jgi:hypothetical protein